jgi:uncharacterized coiled-coil protein SlyX
MEQEERQHCNPSTCIHNALTEAVITDLKEAVHRLMEGQEKMRESLIVMTEAFKAVERLDTRITKLEDEQKFKDREQDKKIDNLRAFMYKACGGASVGAGVLAYLARFIGG